jgi:hypothetical protein
VSWRLGESRTLIGCPLMLLMLLLLPPPLAESIQFRCIWNNSKTIICSHELQADDRHLICRSRYSELRQQNLAGKAETIKLNTHASATMLNMPMLSYGSRGVLNNRLTKTLQLIEIFVVHLIILARLPF